jgi:hypothetical protein
MGFLAAAVFGVVAVIAALLMIKGRTNAPAQPAQRVGDRMAAATAELAR